MLFFHVQSPNSETFPRERMREITTMFPEDPRQPFYNPHSSAMTPLARLYIRKVKSFPRNCDEQFLQAQVLDISENTEDETSRCMNQTKKSFVFFLVNFTDFFC